MRAHRLSGQVLSIFPTTIRRRILQVGKQYWCIRWLVSSTTGFVKQMRYSACWLDRCVGAGSRSLPWCQPASGGTHALGAAGNMGHFMRRQARNNLPSASASASVPNHV